MIRKFFARLFGSFTSHATPAPIATPAERLRLALSDSRFTFRTIGALTSAAGLNESETITILETIGARREYRNPQKWALVSRVGASPRRRESAGY